MRRPRTRTLTLTPAPARALGALALALAALLAASSSFGGPLAATPANAHGLPRARARAGLPRARARAAVIGGVAASSGQFPSVVEVLDVRGRELGECTGAVVAARLVLTAGHCVLNMDSGAVHPAAGFRVLVGSVQDGGQEGQVLDVSSVLVYEGFRRAVDVGDAALLVLAAPTAAPPVALASATDSAALRSGTTATMVGWGKTRYLQDQLTPRLQSAVTAVQSPRWCRRAAPPFYAGQELCTIDPPAYAAGLCEGDSGGPLLAQAGPAGEVVDVGIGVHGYGRCSTRLPSVYTSVSAIGPWLRSWIDAYEAPPSGSAPAGATGAPAATAPSAQTPPSGS